MRGGIPEEAQITALDVGVWVVVGIATVATVGNALMAISTVAPSELPLTGASAVVLIAAAGFAGVRHLRAVRRTNEARQTLALALGDEASARDRLSFARHAAALMSSLPLEEGVGAVLRESLARFSAQAAAVVGDHAALAISEGVDEADAREAVSRLALQTLKAGRSVTVADREAQVAALTAPLRTRDQIRDVMVLWRRGHVFRADDLDGLSIVARIIELSSENAALVKEVRGQLDGTLRILVGLVEQRLPNYGTYSERVGHYAVSTGRLMGMHEDEVEDLRVAALLHDIGMLSVPETILASPRRLTDEEMAALRGHPVHGAELTKDANFPERVQMAVRSHHERIDGMGYPDGLKGDGIPVASRILTVCDAFVALISDRPHRPAVSAAEAIAALRASAGTHYDAGVVEMFVEAQTDVATQGA
jgi:putative nucleotidyltransferase with HDIG domain